MFDHGGRGLLQSAVGGDSRRVVGRKGPPDGRNLSMETSNNLPVQERLCDYTVGSINVFLLYWDV